MVAVRYLALLASLAVVIALTVATGTASATPASNQNKKVCKTSSFTREVKSFAFKSLLLRARMTVSWCWNGEAVTQMEVVCKIDKFDRVTITVSACQAQWAHQPWRGNRRGSAYAIVSVHFSNCVFKYGCWQSAVLHIERKFLSTGQIVTPKEES